MIGFVRRLLGSTALSREEADLLAMLRTSPGVRLAGRDLVLAKGLQGRGMLRAAGAQRFTLTEKGVVALRGERL